MNRMSEKTKDRLGYGTGEGAGYKPRVEGREFNSCSTTVMLADWETKRAVHLLSQGEAMYWHILRFSDEVREIQEQFKLPLEETVALAHELGIKHPRNEATAMTTDFHVIYWDGHEEAHCFKNSRRALEKPRAVEKIALEKEYWERLGIDFRMVYKTDIDVVLAGNIRLCSYFYDEKSVFDAFSTLKHMIIRKEIIVPMDEELILPEILKEHYMEIVEKMDQLGISKGSLI